VPETLQKAFCADGYDCAEAWEECFQTEDKLELYVHGLLFVRKECGLEGVSAQDLSFSKTMGTIRKVLRVAKAIVAKEAQAQENKAELQEVTAREWAKVQAKEGAKEAAKDKKQVAPGEKIRLEEQLGGPYHKQV